MKVIKGAWNVDLVIDPGGDPERAAKRKEGGHLFAKKLIESLRALDRPEGFLEVTVTHPTLVREVAPPETCNECLMVRTNTVRCGCGELACESPSPSASAPASRGETCHLDTPEKPLIAL